MSSPSHRRWRRPTLRRTRIRRLHSRNCVTRPAPVEVGRGSGQKGCVLEWFWTFPRPLFDAQRPVDRDAGSRVFAACGADGRSDGIRPHGHPNHARPAARFFGHDRSRCERVAGPRMRDGRGPCRRCAGAAGLRSRRSRAGRRQRSQRSRHHVDGDRRAGDHGPDHGRLRLVAVAQLRRLRRSAAPESCRDTGRDGTAAATVDIDSRASWRHRPRGRRRSPSRQRRRHGHRRGH